MKLRTSIDAVRARGLPTRSSAEAWRDADSLDMGLWPGELRAETLEHVRCDSR